MIESERLIYRIRVQEKALAKLLNYLESKERWSTEDEQYSQSTLRRIARELINLSRGRLASLEPLPTEEIRLI